WPHGDCRRRGSPRQEGLQTPDRAQTRARNGRPGRTMSIAVPAGADRDALKRAAAYAAAELVRDGMIVGLGTGSTAAFALDALARRHQQGLRFVGIPTSVRTAARAKALGIPLTSFTPHRQIDLTIDGADEVERGTL